MGREIVEQAKQLPVRPEDLRGIDPAAPQVWSTPRAARTRGPLTISWVMSPPSATSGGHLTLFRFIDAAEQAGHHCHIYFYTATDVVVDGAGMREMLRRSGNFPNVTASMQMYEPSHGVHPDTDALFATGWETAYPVFRDRSPAKRFYFVQDFEPAFYPWGSEFLLAEDTYRFGFYGTTAGGWLAQKLASEFGMETQHFDFAVDRKTYRRQQTGRRTGVFFYARPSTPRRGFDIGLAALRELHEAHPEIEIHLAGEDIPQRDLGFPYINHGAVSIGELNAIYNRCAAALVISATNMSLLPLELLASGTIPVVNDGPNNRLVSDNPNIVYAAARPSVLARALADCVNSVDQVQRSERAASSVSDLSWGRSGEAFVTAVEAALGR